MKRRTFSWKKLLVAGLFVSTMLCSVGQSLALSAEQRRIIASGARYYDIPVECASSEANGKIYFLGDSLTVGMRDQGNLQEPFEANGWSDITIQATNGDNITNALPKVDGDRDKITAASTAVIGLGTNRDANFAGQIDALVGKLREFNEEIRIYWVNIYTGPGALVEGGDAKNQEYNQIIRTKSADLGFSVIYWAGEAEANAGRYPFIADNVHHTPEGYTARAEFLAAEVGDPPAALPGTGEPGGSTELAGDTNEEKIFNYLLGKQVAGQPLKDFHVAGILGNMWAESGYRPQRLQGTPLETITPANQVGNAEIGWGLVQWTPGSKFINPTTAAGKDPNNMQVQLDFLLEQLNGGTTSPEGAAGQDLIATGDVGAATLSFETKYERHAGPPQPERITEAQRILDQGFSGSGGGECGNGGDSDLSAKVLEYAWETYREPPFTERKPAYAEAISAAQADGQYVGGGQYPGVDCGGWVTRLMIDSGFEPNYNYGGKSADGAGNVSGGQTPWLEANWEKITVNGTQDLQPGDVAVNTGRSHTFAFVGDIEGFESQIASASYSTSGDSWRAPMAGREDPLASNIEWYRQK